MSKNKSRRAVLFPAIFIPLFVATIAFKGLPTSKLFDKQSLNILVGGDMMFDRIVMIHGNEYGYDSLFSTSTISLFKGSDITVANLEGPITSNPSQTYAEGVLTGSFTFTFPTIVAQTLASVGVNVVSLANNHSGNFGREGYVETLDWLSKSGIHSFGNAWNDSGTEYLVTKNGIKVAFLGYHAFSPGIEKILKDVRRLSDENYFVIVMPHWGPEYETHHTESMRIQAIQFIDAGAKAIIGSHPHVIMDHEWIKGVPVFYSLGNLLFDQYFSADVMKGNMINLHINKDSSGTHADSIKIYTTSTKSKKFVSVSQDNFIIENQ